LHLSKYHIKSQAEAYERNVLECQLTSDVGPVTAAMRSQIAHIGLWTIGFLVEDGLNN
jgi:hypothetical protein